MNEQEFQLELERFRQKSSFENRIAYILLTAVVGGILFYFQKDNFELIPFMLSLGVLAILLFIVELINPYLNNEMKKIKEKIRKDN